MLKPFGTIALAASALIAVLALPGAVHAKDAAVSTAAASASSPAVTARAELTTRKAKRVRKVGTQPLRRMAAVAAPATYHPQCFLFWCSAGGRSFNLLILGVAY